MKLLKYTLLACFFGLAAQAFGQVNINDLSSAIAESPNNTAELVAEAVSQDPDRINAIVGRLLAEYPSLAEAIVSGAINGLPTPKSEDVITGLVEYAIELRPGLAPEIILGARLSTADMPGMDDRIALSARNVLRKGLGVLGRTSADGSDEIEYQTLKISPAR